MKTLRRLAGWMGFIAALAVQADAAPAASRPNFLIILADNVGRDWFSCYDAPAGTTPVIDRLAREGVRFTHFYTTPLCSTTRVEFLTGRYGLRTGWHTHHDAALYGGGGFDAERELTWARALRAAGYATAITGKWQVNDLAEEPGAIEQHGFDEHLVWSGMRPGTGTADQRWRASGQPSGDRSYESRYWDAVVFRNRRREILQGQFGPDVFVDTLIEFMARSRARPFAAYYATPLPALPAVPTPTAPNAQATEREMFSGMVRHLDAQVGRLLAALDRLDLRKNTIVIFATDNATPARLIGPIPAPRERGGERFMTEFDLDMPLIVNCPGRVPAGRVRDALVDASDLFPTLLDLAGVSLPRDVTLDGRSFARLIDEAGSHEYTPREWMFGQYGGVRAIRDERFKLYSTGAFYDLTTDPLERTNLARAQAEPIRSARDKLQGALNRLPSDAILPFRYRSSTAFQIEAAKKKK